MSPIVSADFRNLACVHSENMHWEQHISQMSGPESWTSPDADQQDDIIAQITSPRLLKPLWCHSVFPWGPHSLPKPYGSWKYCLFCQISACSHHSLHSVTARSSSTRGHPHLIRLPRLRKEKQEEEKWEGRGQGTRWTGGKRWRNSWKMRRKKRRRRVRRRRNRRRTKNRRRRRRNSRRWNKRRKSRKRRRKGGEKEEQE